MSNIEKIMTTLALACTVAGCGDYDPNGGGGSPRGNLATEQTENQASHLWLKSATIWDSPSIPVCWENPDAGNATGRAWVEDAVRRTWEAVSRVDFYGWGTCPPIGPQSYGLRVRIGDEPWGTIGMGTQLNGKASGIRLNFYYNNWDQACKTATGPNENCIRTDAVNAFGHALGFAMESNRGTEVNPSCPEANNVGARGDYKIDGYDPDSILNLCADRVKNKWKVTTPNPTIRLSSNDVRGVQQIYGAHPGMLLGFWGRCLDINGSPTTPGTRLITADCAGTASRRVQRWLYNWGPVPSSPGSDGSIFTDAPLASALAVDLPSNDQTPGLQLQLWNRNATSAQGWRIGRPSNTDYMTFRGHGGRCMDVRGNGSANQTPVQLYDCPAFNPFNDAQLWRRDTKGRIVNKNGKCLDVPPGFFVPNGTGVQIFDCHNDSNQVWDFVPPGKIVSRSNGKCLDANVHQLSGVQLQVWDCRGSTNQHWMVRGPISNPYGRCMSVRNFVNAPGTAVESNYCTWAENQLWDYHW